MHRQRVRGAVFSLVLVALTLHLGSCGLPTSDYLYPPSSFLAPSSNLVRLVHETENIDDSVVAALFKGYEIYYRVFDSSSEADTSYTYLSNNLTSSNISTVASSKGYYVLVKSNDTSVPLIPVSDNTRSVFDLHMNQDSGWTITADDATSPLFSILRNKGDSTTADFCKSSEYQSGDHDYQGDGISSDDESVHIVFFAVSYGVSSSLSDLYSAPIVLQPIQQYTPRGSS